MKMRRNKRGLTNAGLKGRRGQHQDALIHGAFVFGRKVTYFLGFEVTLSCASIFIKKITHFKAVPGSLWLDTTPPRSTSACTSDKNLLKVLSAEDKRPFKKMIFWCSCWFGDHRWIANGGVKTNHFIIAGIWR